MYMALPSRNWDSWALSMTISSESGVWKHCTNITNWTQATATTARHKTFCFYRFVQKMLCNLECATKAKTSFFHDGVLSTYSSLLVFYHLISAKYLKVIVNNGKKKVNLADVKSIQEFLYTYFQSLKLLDFLWTCWVFGLLLPIIAIHCIQCRLHMVLICCISLILYSPRAVAL